MVPTKKHSSGVINFNFGVSNKKEEFEKFTHVFLVMELVESDMKKLLSSTPPVPLQEEHIITIIYNSLCALNYMHSANIIHRDIKPGNFLINSSCSVKICDFGLARTMPKKEDDEREFRDNRKKAYKKMDRTGDIEEYK
jgi:serine/threonine protein kinase